MSTSALDKRILSLSLPLLCTQRSSWEQGVAAQAFLEVYSYYKRAKLTPPINLLSLVYGLAQDSIVRQSSDGRLAVVLNGDGSSDYGAVDPACIGESIHFLLLYLPEDQFVVDESRLSLASQKMLAYILNTCPKGAVKEDSPQNLVWSHRTDACQVWSDTIYMLSPFLVSCAIFYSRKPDPDIRISPSTLLHLALQQIILAADVLQSPTGEWSHIYSMDERAMVRKAYWGVGNGWVTAGIVRVYRTIALNLDLLNDLLIYTNDIISFLNKIYKILRDTIDACLRHMLPTGLFYDILDDDTKFIEANLSQELSYSLYRLLDLHLYSDREVIKVLCLQQLDETVVKGWEVKADLMYRAAVAKTDDWGFVREVCGSPRFDHAGTAAEGQAWAIMMEVARAEYLAHKEASEIAAPSSAASADERPS